jgi:Ca2+-binding RTX toxin-like protein
VKDLTGNALASTSITFTTRSLGERLEFQVANEDLPTSYNSVSDLSQQLGFKALLKQGTEGHDQIAGTDATDYILAYGGDDVIDAGAGGDRIYAGSGDDTGSGGDGIDTLVYACNFFETLIEPRNLDTEMLSVTVDDRFGSSIGHDSFTNVERIEFADYGIAFDVSEANQAGGIYRLYQAAFDRVPDLPGLGYWIEQADEGKNAVRMGEDFTWSQEFQSVYQVAITDNYASGVSLDHLVKGFYHNVLGRDPDAGGLTYYSGVIGSHEKTVGRVLAEIADSPENRDLVADDIINGILYRPYAQNVQTLKVDEISEDVPPSWSTETGFDTWSLEPPLNTDWWWFG